VFSIKTCSKLNSKKKKRKKEEEKNRKEKNGFTFKGKKIKYERDMRERGQKVQVIGGG
jgi:hypothetical protein